MKTVKCINPVFIACMYLYPLLYVINGFMPWSQELWVHHNRDFYIPFFLSTAVLHWISLLLVFYILKKSGRAWKDIGFTFSRKGIVVFLFSFLLIAFGIYFFTEFSLNYVVIEESKRMGLSMFFPQTSGERLFFIFIAFSAGFCEETVYRGFNISMPVLNGWNKWLVLVASAIPFVLIHGAYGLTSLSAFSSYCAAGLIFGLLFVLFKRLWIPMSVHILYDLIAIMAIFQCV